MMKKMKINPENMYISQRLTDRLAQMERYPLTVIEAPMGYGKTMGVRSYLKRRMTAYVWQSSMDSSPDYFWKQFCRSFSQIDSEIAQELEAVGFPEDSVLSCMAVHLMNTASIDQHTLLIIDDYQLVFSQKLNYFFQTVARENISNLHVVLIGRNRFDSCREELKLKGFLLTLTERDFKLTEEECGSYFESCGLYLTQQQRKTVYRNTEGWISALYLSLLNYVECGELTADDNMNRLFEGSLYENCSDDQKDFLLRISIFNEFTREQARFVRRKADPSKILDRIVASNGFIRLDSKKVYHIHNMFADFLHAKLLEQDRDYVNEVYRHGADWYYLNREYYLATLYYYYSHDYNEMLKAFERDKANGLSAKSRTSMIDGFEECPKAIRTKHPMANLLYAKQLSMMNEKERLKQTMGDLKEYFKTESLSESRKKELNGEYFMLLSFLSYNDLDRMIRYQQKASRLLLRPSMIEGANGSFTYGSPSIFHMFYREPGTADELVRKMHESREVYHKLTDKNGYGSDYMLEAEVEYNRGNFDKAEILSYKALHLSENENQTGVLVCALFLQARLFMLKGETEKGLSVLKELREKVIDSKRYLFIHTADICKAFIYSMFRQQRSIAEWIADGRFDSTSIYHPALNFVYIAYGRILIESEKYTRFLGEADQFIAAAREFPNLLTEIYLHIYSAVAYKKIGLFSDAFDSMSRAIELAGEDRLYLPFVENGREVLALFDDMLLVGDRSGFAQKVRKIYEENGKNLSVVLSEEEQTPLSILTKREQEIAILVSDGKTNSEIAKALNVAEITVKKSLSNIYARFGITNRAALARMISE